ncbi:MAG: hypothetical protein EOP60_10015 [Sphingomonadales bacterium]|nr:MAG: hypothetical protein EOP60_10015 [Sphingomonadales bacterium]
MWKWIRIPKAIALLAFLLPWVTVSCSGQEVVSASGFGMALGRFSSQLPMATNGASPSGSINLWLILGLAAIVAGLVVSFRAPGRRSTLIIIGTSVAALALIWLGTMRLTKANLLREAAKRSGSGSFENTMDQAAAAMIRIDWHFGFWLSIAGLVVALGMAWLVHSGRGAAVEAALRDILSSRGANPAPPTDQPVPTLTCSACGKRYSGETRFCPDDGTALS